MTGFRGKKQPSFSGLVTTNEVKKAKNTHQNTRLKITGLGAHLTTEDAKKLPLKMKI